MCVMGVGSMGSMGVGSMGMCVMGVGSMGKGARVRVRARVRSVPAVYALFGPRAGGLQLCTVTCSLHERALDYNTEDRASSRRVLHRASYLKLVWSIQAGTLTAGAWVCAK